MENWLKNPEKVENSSQDSTLENRLQSAMEKAQTENRNTLTKFDKISDLKLE